MSPAFRHLCSWENLVLAWRKAARGKRGTASVARFEFRAEEHLADLQRELLAGTYRPGGYVHFHIDDPKRRKISAACFRAQVVPVECGIPWLGFVVYPTHRLVKARKVRHTHRRLRARLAAYHAGEISFGELEASIRGWIAHVGHADTWGLRQRVLDSLVIRPAEYRRGATRNEEPAILRHGRGK